MMKKTYTFGILAAALLITPTAAFADQGSQQELNQNASASGGSQVNQRASQTSIQYQNRLGGSRYGSQSQGSRQLINQNGVATDGSVVNQNANQLNIQRQYIKHHHNW
jgi:hypothetical protein